MGSEKKQRFLWKGRRSLKLEEGRTQRQKSLKHEKKIPFFLKAKHKENHQRF